tara:strand:- start:1033 stop:1512 length:480 start_codon:yes stop_codon:yes gene_type:complete
MSYSKHGENYANDLLKWVGIEKETNMGLYIELADLFNGYEAKDIEEVYKDIMFLCELPNGQIKGRLPQLYEIKKLLNAKKKNKVNSPKVFKDYAMICPQCGAAFSIGQYRCLDGYLIKDIGGGYTQAIPCRDRKDSKVGPMLKKHKLETIPPELLELFN